ncbi:MAG: hypothetical protein NWF01_07820 [Candidatus Bathyarchaeota archaeon]|nr:hypothetical protein [Candidatus Bathyarchaeota archaeon]
MEGYVLKNVYKMLKEYLGSIPSGASASPNAAVFYETATIPLIDIMTLYDKDPTCKSSVDLLAASTVGMGFYTTVDETYEKAAEAKAVIDDFSETVNLDGLLNDMAIRLIACGNDFWLKLKPGQLSEFVRMPSDSIEKILLSKVPGVKIPYKVESYQLKSSYRDGSSNGKLAPDAVLHWHIHQDVNSGYGVGLLQVLLHVLAVGNDKRPAYAWMKAKIERIMPKIFEKYAGPDVLVYLPGAKEDVISKFQNTIKNRPEEGAWLFYNGQDKTNGPNVSLNPLQIDPRARFEYYLDHIINQFYLGCETPLPRLFSTPGFTEASAKAAVELQDMLIKPVQRYVKRQVEREIFAKVLTQNGLDAVKAKARLNWSVSDTPVFLVGDLISAADKNLIRAEEFRKNATKFGWQLWEPEKDAAQPSQSSVSKQSKPGGES